MRLLLLFLFLSIGYFCCAQTRNPALDINRANIWRFGTYSTLGANDVPGLDFSNGTPIVINLSNNRIADGATTVSTLNGSLQLFGGYQSMYDQTDNLLLNAGVVGDSAWIGISPCNLAIPLPKSSNLIYYFSAQVTLKYTVVDMNLNNGKGEAILRNQTLQPTYKSEAKLAAVHNCNGRDIWIVGHRWESDSFFVYLLTDTGIVQPPLYIKIGPVANENSTYQAGSIKFSPDGNKMCIVFGGSDVSPYLFDFDKSTGAISNPVQLQKDLSDNGISFSPDNSKLYISTNNGLIVQYNLLAGSATDIFNSRKEVLNIFNSFSRMQIGRDSRIYVIPGSNPHRKYLTVINNPNDLDTLCHVQVNAIFLNGGQASSRSLMNTVESYFYTGTTAYPCYGDTSTNIFTPGNKAVGIFAYPNPFSEYTVIEISDIDKRDGWDYVLTDAAGSQCNTQIIEQESVWNAQKLLLYRACLPAGIYFFTAKTKHQFKTCKLSIF